MKINPSHRRPDSRKNSQQAAGFGKTGARRTSRSNSPTTDKQRGIAIITVLSVLMLMSVLMLGFFSTASSELDASRHYSASLRSRQLTDVVTNLVVAQIRSATAPLEAGGIRSTWVSQPGAITNFRDSRSTFYRTSVFQKFKLYSSDQMIVSAQENLAGDFSRDWQDLPGEWVDINAPVVKEIDGRDEAYFPIIDPAAQRGDKDENSIEGFTYKTATSTSQTVEGVRLPGGDPSSQRLPMPVRWLYMLDDGTLGHLANKTFQATAGDGSPSEVNPIVARLAFWTDDESCKINVNTASEGVHWDLPRYDSPSERDLGLYQPVLGEVNRYPGHPAMVSLSSVFYPHNTDESEKLEVIEDLLALAPKVAWGGSKAGTVNSIEKIENDKHRLYATPEEVLYRQGEGDDVDNGSPDQNERLYNDVFEGSDGAERRELLRRAKSVLTTNSNAPELTMFGTPRISLWPLHADGHRSDFDRLIEKCTTLGDERYFWQRKSAGSRHQEAYLRKGAGSNVEGVNLHLLYYYMQYMADERIPGYGNSWSSKYGSGDSAELFQILTEMWDQIRITNLNDPNQPEAGGRYGGSSGQIASCCLCGGPPRGGPINGSNQHRERWYRIDQNPAKGFGRLFSLSEIVLVFIPGPLLPNGEESVEVGILLETFCPGHGYSTILPSAMMQIVGFADQSDPQRNWLQGTIGGQKVIVPTGVKEEDGEADSENRDYSRGRSQTVSGDLQMLWGGYGGPRNFAGGDRPPQFVMDPRVSPDGVHNETRIPAREVMALSISKAAVIMYDNTTASTDANNLINNLIQICNFSFPQTSVPKPTGERMTWKARVLQSRNDPEMLIRDGDSTRSIVVSHGDYRLIAGKRVVEEGHFIPHHKYKTTERHAHSLVAQNGTKYNGFSVERGIVANAAYPDEKMPDFPGNPADDEFASLIEGNDNGNHSTDPGVSGDFSTGLGAYPDGPYIDRANDGRVASGRNPYFDEDLLRQPSVTSDDTWMPNLLVSGPGMFGGLSSGIRSNVPWRTLLFRPQPGNHYGAPNQPRQGDLPDHLFMDMFWMPVIEPYAISMPFATRGKINLNYQIVPFDNIKRQTALHALMKAERVTAIPTTAASTYKTGTTADFRNRIDAYETLEQAEHRFAENQLFRSPTEICELYLVPEGEELGTADGGGRREFSYPAMDSFWQTHALTGENLRERPYANMVPRLTTKSNVYKVHMIVQTLKKVPSVPAEQFDADLEKVTGQWRGSAMIERFIDPNIDDLPEYIGDEGLNARSLDYYYQYRVLNLVQWAP